MVLCEGFFLIYCEPDVRVHDEFVLINSIVSIVVGVEFGFNILEQFHRR